MYRNYGDRDFFENGVLVDTEHSDTVFPMLLCRPYPDEEDLYQFGEVEVDLDDFKESGWGDRKVVMDYLGMTEETYTIGAVRDRLHGILFLGQLRGSLLRDDWQRIDKRSICEILKHRLIASDNLDIVW